MHGFYFYVSRFAGSHSPRFRRRKWCRDQVAIGLLAALVALTGCTSTSTDLTSSVTLAITTTSLPTGQVGTAYSTTLAATGGKAPYKWVLTSGALPAGLTLNPSTGAITGTPTETASATILTVTVTDSSIPAQSKSVSLSLTISSSAPAPLAITTTSLPNGQDGNAYSATLAATGGTTPYNWSVSSGTLPAGLSLNAATGAITGTPTATAGATPLTFTDSDSSLPVQTKSINLALTIYSSNGLSVSVSPQNAGLTVTQTLSLTPTTADSAGVNWSVSGSGCSGAACGTLLGHQPYGSRRHLHRAEYGRGLHHHSQQRDE